MSNTSNNEKEKKRKFSRNVEELKEQLDYFLFKRDEAIVISLQGYWGIGKTYFWHNYISEKQKDKHVYISLFGINSLDDIKRKIVLKIYDSNKISNFIKNNPIIGEIIKHKFGVDYSLIASSFNREDFKDIIICFDDFERISPNLSISEVLGFISELKEQYNCKIVLINNNEILKEQDILEHKKIIKRRQNNQNLDDILSDRDMNNFDEIEEEQKTIEKLIVTQNNNFEILEIFSEKIIDVTLRYEPSVGDLVNIVAQKDKKNYIDYGFIEELFNSLENNNKKYNLRLIKQFCLKLELIEDILKNKKILDRYKEELISGIFKTFINGSIELFYIYGTIANEIKNIVFKHKINDIKTILKELEDKSKYILQNEEVEEYKNKIVNAYSRYLYDLQYEDIDFANDFFKLLKNENYDIIKIFELSQISGYIELLIKINPNGKNNYKNFFIKKTKEYIKENIYSIEKLENLFERDFMKIIDQYDELREYYKKLQNEHKNEQLKNLDCEDIIQIINKIYEEKGWDPKKEELLLNSIDKEYIKGCMIKNNEYFKVVSEFIKYLEGFRSTPFKKFYDKTIQVYEELYKEEKYKNKISFLLERLNLNGVKMNEDI